MVLDFENCHSNYLAVKSPKILSFNQEPTLLCGTKRRQEQYMDRCSWRVWAGLFFGRKHIVSFSKSLKPRHKCTHCEGHVSFATFLLTSSEGILMLNEKVWKQQSLLFMMKLRMGREYRIAWYSTLGSVSTQPLSGYMVAGRITGFRISFFSL